MAEIFDFNEIARKAREARKGKDSPDLVMERRDGLIRGKMYDFSPPVTAAGLAEGEGWVLNNEGTAAKNFLFSKGEYAGARDGKHIFRGVPLVNLDNETRRLFFRVEFSGGSKITPEDDTG